MAASRSTRAERRLVRLAVMAFAFLLHVGLGLAVLAAYAWKTGNLIFTNEPHPLDDLVLPAFVAWLVALGALLVVALQNRPRWRLRLQFLVPVVWVTTWLTVVAVVDGYPVAIRAEVRDGAIRAAPTVVDGGMKVMEITNATTEVCDVGLIREGVWLHPNGGPTGFIVGVSLPMLPIDPGETDRWWDRDLEPGRYTIVCAAQGSDPYDLVPDQWIAAADFEVTTR